MTIVKNFHRIRQRCGYINSKYCTIHILSMEFWCVFLFSFCNSCFFSLEFARAFTCSFIRFQWKEFAKNRISMTILCLPSFSYATFTIHRALSLSSSLPLSPSLPIHFVLSMFMYAVNSFSSWTLNENKSQILMKINCSFSEMRQRKRKFVVYMMGKWKYFFFGHFIVFGNWLSMISFQSKLLC